MHLIERPGRAWAKWGVYPFAGLFMFAAFLISCGTGGGAAPASGGESAKAIAVGATGGRTPRLEELAKTDHIALLDLCLDHYRSSKYSDYTCKFTKQERLAGKLNKEEVMDVKFLQTPFSVSMRWTQNPPLADRVLFVEGKWNNQMLVRPSGLLSMVGTVKRAPDGPEAMKGTLHPVNEFGFERSLKSLKGVYEQARKAGDLQQQFGGYTEVGGRKTIVLIRLLPDKAEYQAHRTVTYIDLDYLVPIQIEGFDSSGQRIFRYLYSDIHFNTGLTAADFLPKANHMSDPG